MLTATRTILAVLALTAIGQQLVLHVGASYSTLSFFSYFTNLSNLFAVFVLLFRILDNERGLQAPKWGVMMNGR